MIDYILCDIEGTTTDSQFTEEQLSPFTLANLESFLRINPIELRCLGELMEIPSKLVIPRMRNLLGSDEMMNGAESRPEVQRLQGLIWQQGYASGQLQGHVYSDVKPAFQRWAANEIHIGVYSSMPVWSQKLLFGHSVAGDVAMYIRDHFDLAVCHQHHSVGYTLISMKVFRQPSEILFLSSVERHLDAAREAGLQTTYVSRGTEASTSHKSVASLSEIL